MLPGETPPDERIVAMMTACCMVSKITFEKFCSRIEKVIKKRNKNNKSKIDKIKEDKKPKGKKSKAKKNVE